MGIIAFKKVGIENNVSFEISRLVYAVDIKKDGSAEVMIEGMVTAGHDSDPFNTIEVMIPHNSVSQQKVLNLIDQTETFLDEEIKENNYRSRGGGYKIIDKDNGLVNLSGIDVKIVNVDLKKEERDEYVSIFVNFRAPLKSGETKVFRLTYSVQNFVLKKKSYKYGYEDFIIDTGFYDRSMIEYESGILNDGSKVVNCERIHIWCAFPADFEAIGATPTMTWNEAFLSRGKKDYPKSLLSWDFEEFYPWMFGNRLSFRLRRSFLGIINWLAIIGFGLAVVAIILGIVGVILSFGG
jgi:hypothetical protein